MASKAARQRVIDRRYRPRRWPGVASCRFGISVIWPLWGGEIDRHLSSSTAPNSWHKFGDVGLGDLQHAWYFLWLLRVRAMTRGERPMCRRIGGAIERLPSAEITRCSTLFGMAGSFLPGNSSSHGIFASILSSTTRSGGGPSRKKFRASRNRRR